MPEDLRKAKVAPVFKNGKGDLGKRKLVSLLLTHGNVMKQLILETVSRQMNEKVLISNRIYS